MHRALQLERWVLVGNVQVKINAVKYRSKKHKSLRSELSVQ
jgi:hypothetical protein